MPTFSADGRGRKILELLAHSKMPRSDLLACVDYLGRPKNNERILVALQNHRLVLYEGHDGVFSITGSGRKALEAMQFGVPLVIEEAANGQA